MSENEPSEGDAEGPAPEPVRHEQVAARVPEHVGQGVFSTGALIMTGQNEFVLDFVLRMLRPQQIVARVVLPHRVMPQFIQVLQDHTQRYENRFGPIADLPGAGGRRTQERGARGQEGVHEEQASPQTPEARPASQETGEGAAVDPVAAGQGVGGGAGSQASETSGQSAEAASEADAPGPPEEQTPKGKEKERERPSVEQIYDELKLPDAQLSGTYANAVMVSHSAAAFHFDFLTTFYPRSAVSARVFLPAANVPALLDSMRNTWHHLQKQIEQQRRRQRGEDEGQGRGEDGML
jgi:hypothetical protein